MSVRYVIHHICPWYIMLMSFTSYDREIRKNYEECITQSTITIPVNALNKTCAIPTHFYL